MSAPIYLKAHYYKKCTCLFKQNYSMNVLENLKGTLLHEAGVYILAKVTNTCLWKYLHEIEKCGNFWTSKLRAIF